MRDVTIVLCMPKYSFVTHEIFNCCEVSACTITNHNLGIVSASFLVIFACGSLEVRWFTGSSLVH